jgi:diacylglycerol kinase family enzyme
MAAWVPLAKSRWALRLKTFTETHGGVVLSSEKGNKKDIILIVSPASGNGRAMDAYDEVLGELRATGRAVDVIVTKGVDDVCSLTAEHVDLSPYKVIAVLSGDSMLYELTQAALVKNKGKWPYAPILVLPGGSANCISAENFGEQCTSIKEIIRHGITQSRKASVIRLSSSTSETVRYSLHNAFDGMQRYILENAVENHRGDVYPAFGIPGILGLALYKIATAPVVEHPAVLTIANSDIEAKRSNIGCGVTRFDDKMIVLRVDESQGRFTTMGVGMKFIGGRLAKQWREGMLPDYVHLEVTDKYTFNAHKGESIKMFIDGTGTIPMESDSDVTFTVIPDAIPYFVRDDLPFEDWDVEFTMELHDCLSIEDAFSRVASPSKMKDWTTMEFARNCVVTLPDGMEEPLKKGDEYLLTVGSLKGLAKVSLFETSSAKCVFEVSGSMLWNMVQNKFRTTIYQKDGIIYGMTQEKFVKGRPLANGDEHVRKQHETMLRDLNSVFEKEEFVFVD